MPRTDIHKHICERCGNSWVHNTFDLRDICGLIRTHKCNRCGKMVSAKVYDSNTDERPSFQPEKIEIAMFYRGLEWRGCLDGYFYDTMTLISDYVSLKKELAAIMRQEEENKESRRS